MGWHIPASWWWMVFLEMVIKIRPLEQLLLPVGGHECEEKRERETEFL
jgi:hypothetical protein